MPAANRIKIANDGLIFREDFLNPQTAAANGAVLSAGATIRNDGLFITDDSTTLGQVQYTNAPRISGSFSIIVEFMPFRAGDLSNNYNTILHIGNVVTNQGFVLGLYNNRLLCTPWGTTSIDLGAITLNKPNIIVYTSNTSTGSAQAYVDGVKTLSNPTYLSTAKSFNGKMSIGGTTASFLRGLIGKLTLLQIYNRAFSAEEVRAHYQITRGLLI
jgi:hypothetical protein